MQKPQPKVTVSIKGALAVASDVIYSGCVGWQPVQSIALKLLLSIHIKMNHGSNAYLLHSFLIRNYNQTIHLLWPFDFCSSLSYSLVYVLSVIKRPFLFWYKYSLVAVSFVCAVNITERLTRKLKQSLKLTVLGWCTVNKLCPMGIIPVSEHHASCIETSKYVFFQLPSSGTHINFLMDFLLSCHFSWSRRQKYSSNIHLC